MSVELSSSLAELAGNLTLESLPSGASEIASGYLAATLERARSTPPPAVLDAVLLGLGSPPVCSIFSSGEQVGASYAAYLNAASIADAGAPFDAASAASVVVPACVAAAELDARPGRELLCGVALGLEVALRLAVALGPRHEERGFTLLGSAGRVASALGAARALGLQESQALSAIGFAATEGAGPFRGSGALASLIGGKVAADGLEAALLCGAGLIGPPEPLEGRRGLFALELGGDPSSALEGLGARWFLLDAPPVLCSPALQAAALALSGEGTVAGLLGCTD